MSKELVVCDIDDVIAANADGFISWSNQQFGTNLTKEDYTEDFLTLWPDVDLQEVRRRADMFHDSDAVLSYGHIEEGAASLRALTKWYRFVAATSRRRVGERYTRAWIESSYGDIFEDVVFAGIYDEPAGHGHHLRTKADVFRRLSPRYVIDDQLKHCYAAAEQGISTVLFGSYRWNQAATLPSLITRCINWPETVAYFAGRAA